MENRHRAAPAQQDRHPSTQAGKTPRELLVTFEIEADHCPQVLLRMLGLMSREGTVPATIAVTRSTDMIKIAVELDGASPDRSEHLKWRIEAMPAVRKVSLGNQRDVAVTQVA
jgi:acetolactate synthase regulatory subunit